jgi:hypothetical protein
MGNILLYLGSPLLLWVKESPLLLLVWLRLWVRIWDDQLSRVFDNPARDPLLVSKVVLPVEDTVKSYLWMR